MQLITRILELSTRNAPDKEPPLSLISIVNLAWSLILNISIRKQDVNIGKEVLKGWNQLWKQRQYNSAHASMYLNNIFCLLSSFVESIAFERYFYYEYTRTYEKKRTQTIAYWNDLADMTSFNKDGTILRIVSFLGIGGTSLIGKSDNIGTFLLYGLAGLVASVVIVKYLRTREIRKVVQKDIVWKKASSIGSTAVLYGLKYRNKKQIRTSIELSRWTALI